MTPYETISCFYFGMVAKRSGLPYMNHIDEGLKILNNLNADLATKEAWCLHPIAQNGLKCKNKLACEYAEIANSFLSYHDSHNILELSPELRNLLIADKIQNRKDFLNNRCKYNNADQLERYFEIWLYEILKLSEDEVIFLTASISSGII